MDTSINSVEVCLNRLRTESICLTGVFRHIELSGRAGLKSLVE